MRGAEAVVRAQRDLLPALEADPSRYLGTVRWIALVLLPVLACGAFASAASAHMSTAPSCVTAEVRVHDEAVFGHFATRAGASALKARAARQGFAGIKIEAEGCGDFEVEIDGADTQSQRSSFAKEALKAGYPVTFEQTAPPLQYRPGEVYGIFATKRTVAEANGVMTKLSRNGFLFVDLARQGNSWLVVMPQVPVKAALPIAREAAAAGFHIQFHSGTK